MPPGDRKPGFTDGARTLAEGFRLLRRGDILPWVLVPLAINVIVYAAMLVLLFDWLSTLVSRLVSWLPEWLHFLEWLAWLSGGLLALVLVAYTFTFAANLLAAPFNSILAERVLQSLGAMPARDLGLSAVLAEIPSSLRREAGKLLYFAPRSIAVMLLCLLPPLNLAGSVLWFAFGAWCLALEYCDFAAETTQDSFLSLRRSASSSRAAVMGLGSAAMAITMVPLLSLFVMPATVCAGALLWHRLQAPGKR